MHLDRTRACPYNRTSTVKHFFDFDELLDGPAATRWAVLFYAQFSNASIASRSHMKTIASRSPE
jgi:hypothetical protein